MLYLVAKCLPVVLPQINISEGSIMEGVQLLKSMQHHDCLLPDQLLGVGQQLDRPRQDRIHQIRANQLAGGSQSRADYSERHDLRVES